MNTRRFSPAATLIVLSAFSVIGNLCAQSRVPGGFYTAPTPSDFASDIGERPDGGGGAASLDPGALFAASPFTYAFSVREGYDDNLFTTKTDTDSSFYTNIAAGVAYQFGSPRLQLNANLGGGVTYFYTRPGDKVDFNGQFAISAVYLATPRLTLSLNSTIAYLSQPDTNIIGGTNRVNGDYVYTNTSLEAAYQWTEKFSTVTGYQAYANYYMEEELNDTQSFWSSTVKQAFRWLLLPKTTIVAEYRANPIIYTGGAELNSFGNFALLGFDQIFNPRFKWTARLGVEQRFNENPVDGNSTYFGPFGESNLSYQFGPASTISWNARYGTEPSGLTNVTQRQTFRTGLAVAHAFTPRISANLGFNFEIDYFDQSGVITSYYQTIFDVAVGVTYKINRNVSLSVGYQYVDVISQENASVEYARNVGFVGANFNF